MHWAILAALLSGMSFAGWRNIKEQRRYYGVLKTNLDTY